MKNLIIPAECDNSSINITDIDNEFNGLIIAYKNDVPFCYIQYNNQWEYNSTINIEYSENWDYCKYCQYSENKARLFSKSNK